MVPRHYWQSIGIEQTVYNNLYMIFFHLVKNKSSRHYVGGSGQPIFPLSENYAQIELTKHKPWSINEPLPLSEEMIKIFEGFLEDPKCPTTLKLSYERAKLKFYQKKRGMKEVTAPDQEDSNPTSEFVDRDTIDTLATTTNLCSILNEIQDLENSGIHTGQKYNWSKRIYQVSYLMKAN